MTETRYIFNNSEYIPENIIKEYKLQWSKITKITLDQFLDQICTMYSSDKEWWKGIDDLRNSYMDYLLGKIDAYYPPLPVQPKQILLQVVKEANEMIKF